jgi:hypothetical protein
MATFTTRLNGRKERDLKLTIDEALAMHELGFRFAEYAPENDRCRLSAPFRLLIIPGKDELTIEQ